MSYLIKYVFFSIVNFMLFSIPFLIAHRLIESVIGPGDILTGISAIIVIGYLLLIRVVLQYQIDPQVGYLQGWKLGFNALKGYVGLLIGR
jgi:hypothetical protein